MRVEFKSLKPNPFRNFKVDPIDQEVVKALKQSIKENPAGFWGGIVARRKNGHIELAFGHHRIEAAKALGIREDDIKVAEISDAEMIRMYAEENATQRGNSGTAIAGTVISAAKFLLKGLFTGNLAGFPATSKRALEVMLGQTANERGLGHVILEEFLHDIPGVNENTIRQQLANLKASGDYDEAVNAVKDEIEQENKEALKRLAQAEREAAKAAEEAAKAKAKEEADEKRRKEDIAAANARAKASKEESDRKAAEAAQKNAELARQKAEAEAKLIEKRRKEADEQLKGFDALRQIRDAANKAASVEREVTFDFEGVAKHLKLPSHIDVFREAVTGEGLRPYLAVNRQAALAKRLVDEMKSINGERAKQGKAQIDISASFIREHVMEMVLNVQTAQRQYNKQERDDLLKQDWSAKAKLYQEEFARNARGMLTAAFDLSAHARKRPQGVTLHLTSEFRNAIGKVESALDTLKKAGVI